jgi:hypothetical protein
MDWSVIAVEDAMPSRALLVLAAVLFASPGSAAAQTLMRPEPAPARVAGNEAWYRAGEPVMHRGQVYYPGGAQIFFNPTVMVLAGEFRGVPVYVDPTIETGSIVYLPVGAGVMQPYERLRTGELAGTSGSRTPTYPPATATTLEPDPQAVGTIGVVPPAPPVGEPSARPVAVRASQPQRIMTIAPNTTARGRGVWIEWNGQEWRAAGAAVRVGPQLVPIGTYNGRTVYQGPGGDGTIWIETAQGLATPWRR